MKFARSFFGIAAFCAAGLVNMAAADGSCHIHPLGIDAKDAEARIVEWYNSLEECEVANKKFFGGLGTCHCFPDGIFNRSIDDWRSRPKDFRRPQELPSD